MKVFALLSGGKDSVFALEEVRRTNHEVVAVLHLYTHQADVYEVDSYMYQTVGSELVETIATDCLELPFLSRELKGTPVSVNSLEYDETDGDEVEDLHALIVQAMDQFPGVEGVCCGAVMSTYQKLRVENICTRLNLISLCPLWNQPQASLLRRMIENDVTAIIIKTATLGLGLEHIGKTIAQMETELLQLEKKYGCHVCGEGGEFETLTLDSKAYKRKLHIDTYYVHRHTPDPFAPVYLLVPLRWRTTLKNSQTMTAMDSGVRYYQTKRFEHLLRQQAQQAQLPQMTSTEHSGATS
eukprot:GHVS01040116.1.p1 GENE.GHVS01040116.1~~GHVS01040116.1.p1  ORF type:complete len:297 (-),score=34.41 GHVS01040116.1:1306-2196(-)